MATVAAVIASTGHLSLELGGPRQFGPHGPDPEFDRKAVAWIADGDVDGCLAEVTLDSLHAPGNAAPRSTLSGPTDRSLPSKQEEVAAAEIAPVGQKYPVESSLDGTSGAYTPKLDRSAMWTACRECSQLKRLSH